MAPARDIWRAGQARPTGTLGLALDRPALASADGSKGLANARHEPGARFRAGAGLVDDAVEFQP
jgi:hypothetical protein